jgi:hypothetical protein
MMTIDRLVIMLQQGAGLGEHSKWSNKILKEY